MMDLNASLNDTATFLISIEYSDLSELSRLQELLKAMGEDSACPELLRAKLLQSVETVGGLMDAFDPAEADEVLGQVGQIIEDAMNEMEEGVTPDIPSPVSASECKEHPAAGEPGPEAEDLPESEASLMPADVDADLVAAFITESTDLINTAEDALLALEMNMDDMDAVSTVFRAFHTIKGTAAFLELSLISELAHHSESFLTRIRDREIPYAGGYPDLALRSVDMLKELIQSVQNVSGGESFCKPRGYDDLMRALVNPEKAGISEESPSPISEAERVPDIPLESDDEPPLYQTSEDFGELCRVVLKTSEVFEEESFEEEPDEEEPDEEEPDEEELDEELPDDEEALPDEVGVKPKPAPHSVETLPKPKKPKRVGNVAEASVRVPIERLDRFIDMVGELVVAHSMVIQDDVVSEGGHHELMKKVTLTSKIVRELQNMSMSMRMIPLQGTFRKMARIIRDLARKAGKNVRFATEGEDTEIDRNMVDIINDPLVHMVRNAVDHGIEQPEVREKLGKPRQGTVTLSARHSAGNVMVEVKDDGRGMDRKAIFEKAKESGLIDDDPESVFGDQELFGLIFEPGFSTAKIVSEVSGRGVGMNVVKTNIETLRGQIEIQSRPGKGSVFKMSLPLTLAIIDGMVVRVGAEKYVMPTISIVRSVQPNLSDISTILNHGKTLTLQGRLIPLFRLADLFQIEGAETDPEKSIVMVVEEDGKQAGIIIDELIGSQQIVIKTLGEIMRNIPGISGSAIMPNGRVGLILDVGGLVSLAHKG